MIELMIVIAIVAAAALYLFKTYFYSLTGKKGGGCQCSGCSCDECPEISIGNAERRDENE